jgi:hypothetical protein
MSNCSEPHDGKTGADIGTELLPMLVQILEGLSSEWLAVGTEIVRVGDAVTDIAMNGKGKFSVTQLQSFDILSQNAHAQAALMKGLSRLIAAGEGCATGVCALVESIPLPEVRRRLREAMGAATPAIADAAAEDVEFWEAELLPPETCS